MTTKMVINATKLSQHPAVTTTTTNNTRGISIVIDKDQLQQHQQHLQPIQNGKKIAIYQQQQAATTTTSAPIEISTTLREMSLLKNKPIINTDAPTTTTIIETTTTVIKNDDHHEDDYDRNDMIISNKVYNNNNVYIKNHNNNVANNLAKHNDVASDNDDDKHHNRNETGYTKTTFPHLLLKVVTEPVATTTTQITTTTVSAQTISERGKPDSGAVEEKAEMLEIAKEMKFRRVEIGKTQANVNSNNNSNNNNKNSNIENNIIIVNGVNGESKNTNDEHQQMMIIHCNEQNVDDNYEIRHNNKNDNGDRNVNGCCSSENGQVSNYDSMSKHSLIVVAGAGAVADNDNESNNDDNDDGFNAQQRATATAGVENNFTSTTKNSLTTKTVTATALAKDAKPTTNCSSYNNSSALTTTTTTADRNNEKHILKIQIKPIENEEDRIVINEVENSLSLEENYEKKPEELNFEKQITVVNLNNNNNNIKNCDSDSVEQNCVGRKVLAVKEESGLASKKPIDLHLNIIDKMVQRQTNSAQNNNNHNNKVKGQSNNGQGQNNVLTSGSAATTITELNVTNASSPPYLYYMMSSSGQFSPCDTLDSGTGSDIECNGNHLNGGKTKILTNVLNGVNNGNSNSASAVGIQKLEMHLKTTKIRVNSKDNCSNQKHNGSGGGSECNDEHVRAGSLTDSEDSSESSSLSCESLHSSSDYMQRQISMSPTTRILKGPTATTSLGAVKMLSTFLPDSLLRDICELRDRKFLANDFETKYGDGNLNGDGEQNGHQNTNAQLEAQIKLLQERNKNNNNATTTTTTTTVNNKRSSLPNKTFVLNTEDGTFIDTKMNSMPRKYEADQYYNFHVHEHENFRSFGNNNQNNGDIGSIGSLDDDASLSEFDIKCMNDDDAFAGYKDIRCGSTSTIRSAKGTVRGVKNRVRNGIATFLQLQQPNVKNYKEKDLGKVVLYTTSMGIIRDTYAKCANVKQILRTLLVKFEERDIFMSVEYQQEIKERMHSDIIKVPQLFVEGQPIGDAETVERLNESGELRQLLKAYKSISTMYTCQTCGGYRLLPCPSCNGSKKSVHRNHFTAEFVALKCMNCDEVGLVKCHNC